MIDKAAKKAARLSFAADLAESDIDRLVNAASSSNTADRAAEAHRALAARRREESGGPQAAQTFTVWDVPVLILFACLGVFTRIWTDVTLYFDFAGSSGFRAFVVVVAIVMHLFIFAIIGNAWRAKWEIRSRNFSALAVLIGYMGFRTLTHL